MDFCNRNRNIITLVGICCSLRHWVFSFLNWSLIGWGNGLTMSQFWGIFTLIINWWINKWYKLGILLLLFNYLKKIAIMVFFREIENHTARKVPIFYRHIFFTGMQRRGFREWSEYIGQDQQVHPWFVDLRFHRLH